MYNDMLAWSPGIFDFAIFPAFTVFTWLSVTVFISLVQKSMHPLFKLNHYLMLENDI